MSAFLFDLGYSAINPFTCSAATSAPLAGPVSVPSFLRCTRRWRRGEKSERSGRPPVRLRKALSPPSAALCAARPSHVSESAIVCSCGTSSGSALSAASSASSAVMMRSPAH